MFFWLVGALYAFGAVVHVGNILGLAGRPWSATPLLWRTFDVVFLVLDASVAIGVAISSGVAVAAFVLAAILQIVLYAGFAEHFSHTPEQAAAIRQLLFLNGALLATFVLLLLLRSRARTS